MEEKEVHLVKRVSKELGELAEEIGYSESILIAYTPAVELTLFYDMILIPKIKERKISCQQDRE